jgi:protease I
MSRRIAFILAQDFEDSEFEQPYEALRADGHDCVIIGAEAGATVEGKRGGTATIETSVGDVDAGEFDALVIPGGYSPDHLRSDEGMVDLTRKIADAGKPVAAICHAGWMLVEADLAEGRRVTSYWSIRTDMENAGADWVDEEVVVDGNVITARYPDDLPAFIDAIKDQIAT